MVQVQSKFTPIGATCQEYVHPWTESCTIATAGFLVQGSMECLKIYTTVYVLSLLMRGRIPSGKDLKRTIVGIIQSSAFLTNSAFSYSLFLCFLRKICGSFNFMTVAYVPAFMSSLVSIFIERPSRRGLLSLYVANVATETLWRMAAARNIVRPLRGGKIMLFGVSISVLLYYFRRGLHLEQRDSIFDILRFVVGRHEEHTPINLVSEQPSVTNEPQSQPVTEPNLPSNLNKHLLETCYRQVVQKIGALERHERCTHAGSCLLYALRGGLRLSSIGLALQITLKLAMNVRRLITGRRGVLRKIVFTSNILKLAGFLGGFAITFRALSCILRHMLNSDSPLHAVPAGLAASVAFACFPDTSVALYVMWKAMQISYNLGTDAGYFPPVSGFTILLYCASTATLFHAATLEPQNLRPSYWKFLHSLSGGRVACMDRTCMDVWGLNTSAALNDVLRHTNTTKNIQVNF